LVLKEHLHDLRVEIKFFQKVHLDVNKKTAYMEKLPNPTPPPSKKEEIVYPRACTFEQNTIICN